MDINGLVGRILCTVVGLGAVGMTAPVMNAQAAEHRTMVQDRTGIERTMAAYNAALNGGDTAAVLPLYTENGVFMAPYSASFVGRHSVKEAYDKVFGELKFDVKFNIAEIVQMAPDWAFVRTNSAGTTLHHSTGRTTAEANQELFILQKASDGHWRIARYSFSPTSAPDAG
jgi:uncharacterized protein (TIGR02246 family)